MRKALVAVVAAILLIGVGAYFGWDLWAQFRTKSEVEAVFQSLRSTFATASHGRVQLLKKSRTVKIADVVLQSQDKATTIKIGQIVAVGTKGPVAGRVSATRIELTDWELSTTVPISTGPAVVYKAASIVIENFAGPASFPEMINTASMIDVSRASLEYLAASSATAVTMPSLYVSVTPRKVEGAPPAVTPVEYTYSELALRNIGEGRIAAISAARCTVTGQGPTPEVGSFAGIIANLSLADFNINAAVALLSPSKAADDSYLQLYRQATTGPFELRVANGPSFQIDSLTVEDIGIKPSKLSIINILAIADSTPAPGTVPTPAQLRVLLDQIAYMYEGIRIGKFEVRGIKAAVAPDGNFSLAAMRMSGLENGRLAEYAFEGLQGQSPQGQPVRVGRFALQGLHIANLVRQSARLTELGPKASPDQLVGLLALLEGIELSDVSVNIDGQQPITIDAFRLSWGRFVGPIPSAIHFAEKTTVPTGLADPVLRGILADVGLSKVTTSVDLGAAWNETTQTLEIAPVRFEIVDGFVLAAKLSIHNVPRSIFSTDLGQVLIAADQLEAGPFELSLRDTGALKTALEQYAKSKNLSVDDARKQIIESVNETIQSTGKSNADSAAIAQAITKFIEAPGSTLTISVTPKSPIRFKQAFDMANNDPNAIASLFTVEAKTTP